MGKRFFKSIITLYNTWIDSSTKKTLWKHFLDLDLKDRIFLNKFEFWIKNVSSLTHFLTSNYNGLSNNRVPQLLKPNTFIKHKNKWVLNVLQNKYIYYFFNKSHFVFDIKNTCTDIFLVSGTGIWYEHYTVVWFWPWY